MDQQQNQARGRSPSASSAHQQPHHISQSHSPSPARPFNSNDPTSQANIGLGLGLEASSQQFPGSQPDFSTYNPANNAFLNPDVSYDPNQNFTDQLKSDGSQFNQSFLAPQAPFSEDFTIFPSSSDQLGTLNTPLFAGGDSQDMNAMAAPQTHHSPTPPHLLKPDPHQPGSAHHSPSFNAHQFSSPAGGHSRHASLGPDAALLQRQVDWSAAQFQGHRRTPSEFSDASSMGHRSPAMVGQETFPDHLDHSPMVRAQDANVYNELHGIGSFSLSDNSPHRNGRSPSHSPAISPRILPQALPEMGQASSYVPQAPGAGYGAQPYMHGAESFPQLPTSAAMGPPAMPAAMSVPNIEIFEAPSAVRSGFEGKSNMDMDALTPPERGTIVEKARTRLAPPTDSWKTGRQARRRAVTDPYNNGGAPARGSPGSLSPNLGADSRSDSSRSLSPLDRSSASPNRRRQSTSAVPNNVMALRLADPEFAAANSGDAAGVGGPKRVQKHPATFQCTLCPKRFTRAYNLRSHLRTHTDERPFVCTVCSKAFARQHDRKRHEGLHSGEKKFVCKGELKAGGQWGCGRRFARADALGRHFRSEAGRICIKPLLDEELLERQRVWNEQRMQQAQQSMMMAPVDPNTGYPIDAAGNYALPAAILAQYPALAQVNWAAQDMGGAGSGMEDEMSGRSSFEASDYDDGDDGGYVSGPGSGFGPGGLSEGFGEIGYASDYGGR